MKRFIHIAGIVLALASLVLTELFKDSHYAWAGVAIGLVTNLRTAVQGLGGTSAAVLALFAGLSVGSCATVKPVVVDCAKAVSPDILPAVESALVADDWVSQLTALSTKYGLCVLNKAIAVIMNESIQDKSFASGDTLAAKKVDHGNAWLSAHPAP